MSFEGVFGLGQWVFIFLLILATVLTSLYGKKISDDDKKLRLYMRILGLILFVFIVLNRIFVTYSDVAVNHREGYTWFNLIPNTYCGISSLVFSLTLIFGKKDNVVLHCILYLGFIGGLITVIYPDFLESQKFFDPRSLTGLLHHGMMILCANVCIISKYMKPSMKRWNALPLGCSLIITFGVFLMDALKFRKAMQVHLPFLSSEPVLTSWYVIGVVMLLLHFLFILWYEMKVNKKTFKEIFTK